MAADDDVWVAWEPPAYLEARPSLHAESAHFVVRWGLDGPESARAAAAAPALLGWLEQCWALFCSPSPDYFVTPYTSPGWSDDGLRRKLNVYIGQTGLHPHPHDAGWAHQGTFVEEPVEAVRHAFGNPNAKLHHSFLALMPGAAEAERTVVHEFAHVLQMHTGGHIDSDLVGYQWEGHAEYCTHLRNPTWAPHLPIFLRTAHLPIDCTNYDGDGDGGGRQYIIWPFYCHLDAVYGRGTAHALWHADRHQRQAGSGRSLDMISNLRSTRMQPTTEEHTSPSRHPPASLAELFGEFARASLTLDWACASRGREHAAALLAAADPLDPLRFTPLVPTAHGPPVAGVAAGHDAQAAASIASWWAPDGSRPLKRCGFAAHRLSIDPTVQDEEVVIVLVARPPTGGTAPHNATPPCDLLLGVVEFDPRSGTRHHAVPHLVRARVGGGMVVARFTPRAGMTTLLSVCACPRADSDFVPLPWGVPPSTLPTSTYVLGLSMGCQSHAACGAADVQQLQPSAPPLTVPRGPFPTVAVPTGLGSWCPQPRLSGGGASITAIDIRSGNPNEVNIVNLSSPEIRAKGHSLLRLSMCYRYVVGYSGNAGGPGPRFEMQLIDHVTDHGGGRAVAATQQASGARSNEGVATDQLANGVQLPAWATMRGGGGCDCAACDAVEEADTTHVLYSSREFTCHPSWDTANGGSPTNYSPPIRLCAHECRAGPFRGERQSLRLVFHNGKRNIHLTGAEGAPPCELGIELEFEPEETSHGEQPDIF